MTASAVIEGGPESRTERAFPALDGLRAVAATAVLVHHAGFWTGGYTPDLLGRSVSRLDVGVPIFFVLSGFLLSRPFVLAAMRDRPAPRPAAYLWRRALRILPAYWITVVAALLLLPGNEDVGVEGWIRYLTLTHIYGEHNTGVGLTHTWSLATEVSFYLLLPLVALGLARLLRRRPERPTGALLALAGAAVLGPVVIGLHWETLATVSLATDLWLPGFAGWFAAGIALAIVGAADQEWRPVRLARELGASTATCWAAAGVLFWLATTPLAGPMTLAYPTAGQAVLKNVLYLGIATLLVLPLVVGDQRAGLGRRLLSSPVMRFLGEISYGVFLIHLGLLAGVYALFGFVQFTGSLYLVAVPVWLLSVAGATVLHYAVERPLGRFRGLVPDRRSATTGATTEATTADTATSASS